MTCGQGKRFRFVLDPMVFFECVGRLNGTDVGRLGEQILQISCCHAGSNVLPFRSRHCHGHGEVRAFRFSTGGLASHSSAGCTGEVEDYPITSGCTQPIYIWGYFSSSSVVGTWKQISRLLSRCKTGRRRPGVTRYNLFRGVVVFHD